MSVIDSNEGSAASPISEVAALGAINNVTITNDASTPAGETPTVYIAADAAVGGTVNITSANGAAVYVTEPVSALGTVNLHADGGSIYLDGTTVSALSHTKATIGNGGTLTTDSGTLVGLLNGGGVTFGTGGGTLDITDTGNTILNLTAGQAIAGYQAGDSIIDGAVSYADVAHYVVTDSGGNQIVTFENANGTSLGALTFTGGTFPQTGTFASNAGPLHIDNDGGVVDLATCFLRGTRIATPSGETRVEALRAGDKVMTLNGPQEIVWVGHQHVAGPRMAGDGTDPVRIRAGAFGEALPRRDLLVTPEHCLYVVGRFIPARMLVNGGSISFDRQIAGYSYYHVELARHGILLSEGMPSESYLDTGNRDRFANGGARRAKTSAGTWERDAAAPLAVDRATVEPVWRWLAERSAALGHGAPEAPPLTGDPALHVAAETGEVILPYRVAGRYHSFLIPPGCAGLRLKSRAARPCDVVGPFLDDRRQLGVMVGEISLLHNGGEALLAAGGSGWHAPEGRNCWTGGDAALAVDPELLSDRTTLLRVEMVHGGPYLADVHETRGHALAA